ncbi:unnamed protein product [Candidula unifasciata]|uniref:HSF-type DNA-binding domain-containing protein n=1 Tax=Candidula unifasciata TaxID=100452 RepID=A0A8S3ZDG7_9EUPU|nr:unnamed protein product [Candidula unifasciata]
MATTERISFGSHYKFPLKLYQVADDETIIKWADDGNSVVVEQVEFEDNVMLFYPGFVQVRSFHNLRRLFRDYGFRFQVLRKRKPYGLKLKFRHPFFTRTRPGDVVQVRKISRKNPSPPKCIDTDLPRQPYFSKQRVFKYSKYEHKLNSKMDILGTSCGGQYIQPSAAPSTLDDDNTETRSSTVQTLPVNTILPKMSHQHQDPRPGSVQLTPYDILHLAQILAKNEMSEAEFWQLITRRRGLVWADKSWDATLNLLTNLVNPELSLLHHQGFYYQLSIGEL